MGFEVLAMSGSLDADELPRDAVGSVAAAKMIHNRIWVAFNTTRMLPKIGGIGTEIDFLFSACKLRGPSNEYCFRVY